MSKRRVRFQTSIEESDESEARRIFLQFERGQSGHLDLKQFKQAVAELDVTNKAKVVHRYISLDSNIKTVKLPGGEIVPKNRPGWKWLR